MSVACGVAISLLLDVSGSVSDEHFALQRDMTAAALQSQAVVNATRDRLAITAVMWGSGQSVVLPWRILTSAADAERAAAALRQVARPGAGQTDMVGALRAGMASFDTVPCEPERRVIDISGDGAHSGQASEVAVVVGDIVEAQIELNALAIITYVEPDIADWYREHVTGPANGFTIEATPEAFGQAIKRKLATEVASR